MEIEMNIPAFDLVPRQRQLRCTGRVMRVEGCYQLRGFAVVGRIEDERRPGQRRRRSGSRVASLSSNKRRRPRKPLCLPIGSERAKLHHPRIVSRDNLLLTPIRVLNRFTTPGRQSPTT